MKNILLFLIISVAIWSCEMLNKTENTVKSENKIDLSFINNSKIYYEIALIACDSCVPISDIGYRVSVKLNKEQQIAISQIKAETWIKLLKDTSSDWAANLILYDLYDESAIVLEEFGKKTWQIYLKNNDIIFWEEKFGLKDNT